ncbi:MAG: response regulator transcription factor [Ignavibacteriaceae bacterium]|nr:response regulator transcription factor [Ignavibacteriaceae bacterium]
MKTFSVIVAEDHNIVRAGIVNIINSSGEFFVVGEAANGLDLIEKFKSFKPDIIISDINMKKMNGLTAIHKILEIDPNAKVLFLSVHSDTRTINLAKTNGAWGYLHKSCFQGELIRALKCIVNGDKYFSEAEEKDAFELNQSNEPTNNFSFLDEEYIFEDEREENILRLIADCKSSKEIAAILNTSQKTIERIRSLLMERFNLRSHTELVRFAVLFVVKYPKK